MFSPEFRKRLKGGKYSKWAADLTEDELEALFWAIGEYGYRASDPLEVLRRYSPTKDGCYARYMTGLLTIAEFAGGKTTDLNSFFPRLQSARFDRDEPPPVSSAFHHDGLIIVKLETGMELRFPVSENPKLAGGTDEQLNNIEISLWAIHWPALNVFLSFRSLLWGDFGQQTTPH